jgi:hypothetical protein
MSLRSKGALSATAAQLGSAEVAMPEDGWESASTMMLDIQVAGVF